MQPEPKISVLMPAFNAEKYISTAIESILSQSFDDFEFIIIDDGSTDDTADIIKSYSDTRIKYHYQQNNGIAAALNKGLELAKSSIIARFDADDISMPERLGRQYQLFSNEPSLVIAGTAVDYIDEEGQFVYSWKPEASDHESIRALVKKSCPFIHTSVMFRKDFVISAGGYNEQAHSFEDHLLWLQILDKGRSMNLNEPLVQVRLNAASITIDERWRPDKFRKIKSNVLHNGKINEVQGAELKAIIKKQNRLNWKNGAYYALLGKKYLWNNYQPRMARTNLIKSIRFNPFYTPGYGLLAVTLLPRKMVGALYRSFKSFQ